MRNETISIIDNINFEIITTNFVEMSKDCTEVTQKEKYFVEMYFEDIELNDYLYVNIYINSKEEENKIYKGHFNSEGDCNWEEVYCNYDIDPIKELAINKVFLLIQPF